MTFAVRTITRSATGGDIVHRPQVLDVDEVTVGRGSGCDIRLSDLAVSLQHAKIRQTGKDRVLVESLGSEPFETGGKFTTRAELNVSAQPKLMFGSHVLALSPSEEDDSILVDVTRTESGPETASEVNEEKIFSLSSASFGKRPIAWGLAAVALALCLAWPIVAFVTQSNRVIHADQQWSAGPLSHSHAFLSRNCQACHQKAFVSVRDEACLSCHQATNTPEAARLVAETERKWGGPEKVTLVQDHAAHDLLRDAKPMPMDTSGRLQAIVRRQFNHPNDRCASCHLEHLADAPKKTLAAASNVAPAPSPREKPTLKTVTDCTDCHAKLHERLDNTTVRDAPDWGHHPEFRPLIARTPFGSAPPVVYRISLVERPSDYTGLIFSHQEHLSKTGGVARMAQGLRMSGGALSCADCHRANKSGGFAPVEMVRDCSSCHSLAFAPGAGGAPRMLPHAHPDQVVATLRGYSGSAGAEESGRRPPGFLAKLGMMFGSFTGGGDHGAPTAKIRALFAPKGLCSECHAAVAPVDPASLDYRIVPIHVTNRYLPWGAFDHSTPEHHQDAAGNPNCETCHQAAQSTSASDVVLPRISECATCHGKSKAKIATAASGDCAECHSYHAPGMATPKGDRAKTPSEPAGTVRNVAWSDASGRRY